MSDVRMRSGLLSRPDKAFLIPKQNTACMDIVSVVMKCLLEFKEYDKSTAKSNVMLYLP